MASSDARTFKDVVTGGVIAGISFAQMSAWTDAVDAYIARIAGPIESDPVGMTVRAFLITATTVVAAWAVHRCGAF